MSVGLSREVLADMSDQEALRLGHPGEVDPEQSARLHAFRDVTGDDDDFAVVVHRIILAELVQGASRRPRGVVEAFLT